MRDQWLILGLDADKSITGVERQSDGARFYVGDRTKSGIIRKFEVSDTTILVYLGGASMYGISELRRFSTVFLDNLQ
jgi:hypothetical protein